MAIRSSLKTATTFITTADHSEFDFLGKDSIRYHKNVVVEKRVFMNLQEFKQDKQNGEKLFDRLDVTTISYMSLLT